MPTLVRFLVRNAVIGFVIALVAMSTILAFDFGGLRSLAMGSDMGIVAIGALTWALGLTFASAQMGFAIMLLNDTQPGDDGPKRRHRIVRMLRPAPSALRARSRVTSGIEYHSLA
jgi:hypothetical protein